MCGIFGGYNIGFKETEKGINLIKRGNDGITISELEDKVFLQQEDMQLNFLEMKKIY